jgi:hypothetical protein
MYQTAVHNIGKMALSVSNFGRFGTGKDDPVIDAFYGTSAPSCQFPKGSATVYLYKGGIWIGGVIGNDTLVSASTDMNNYYREFNPEVAPLGQIVRRSSIDPLSPLYAGAVSEQDFVATYADTVVSPNAYPSIDAETNRPHRPLGLEVQQSSYGWSFGYTQDFTLFNLRIRNVGKNSIQSAYVGVYMDIDVNRFLTFPPPPPFGDGGAFKFPGGGRDDMTGFLLAAPAKYLNTPCEFNDTVRVGWTADNDGDGSIYDLTFQLPNVVGVRFLRPPSPEQTMSFNWWAINGNYDYGPQLRSHYRDMGGGTPYGDKNKYFLLQNGEIDIDQVMLGTRSPIDPDIAIPNDDEMRTFVRGGDGSFLMSIGPYNLDPGDEINVPFAIVGAEKFHTDVNNFFYQIMWRYLPRQYYEDLNFSELSKNAAWAARVFDTPGLDSDSDGYAGKFQVCIVDSEKVGGEWKPTSADTIYYEGDGVPDWKASAPPPAPKVWVYPKRDGLTVRFNGYRTETTRDFLTNELDFEGYHVYVGLDEREGSLALVGSYDREDYDIYFFNKNHKPRPGWELEGTPVSLSAIRCRFSKQDDPCNDTLLDPVFYGIDNPWRSAIYPDSIFYFAAHDANAFKFGSNTPIYKRYPDAPRPVDPHNPKPEDLTDDGYLKYWEYECTIDKLLPTLLYYVNVTAFDYGSPEQGLQPLETAKSLNPLSVYPQADANQATGTLPPVYIYPNPYRGDGNYRSQGFEAHGKLDLADSRAHEVHFVNVPAKCTIRVLTLDGDLIKQIDHDVDPKDSKCHYAVWDMITRNTQAIVSGLYYWTVEDTDGKVQIGKLAVIL